MWDDIYAAGLCLYVEWFLNLIHHVLRHLLCKQMVAMTSSDMSRSVFGFAWRRQSDMTHADFCVYILWCATSFAVYSFLGLLSWSACSLEFEFSNCIRPEPRARRPRFVSWKPECRQSRTLLRTWNRLVVMQCVGTAPPDDWLWGCCAGRLSLLTTTYYDQCNQMKGKCPADCMPIVHPNTKARSELISHCLFACILLAVVVWWAFGSFHLSTGLIATRHDNLIHGNITTFNTHTHTQKKYDPAAGYMNSGCLQVCMWFHLCVELCVYSL